MTALFAVGGFPTSADEFLLSEEGEPEPGPQPDPERPSGGAYRRGKKFTYHIGGRTIYGTAKGIATILRNLAQEHAEEDAKVAKATVRKLKPASVGKPLLVAQEIPPQIVAEAAQDQVFAAEVQQMYQAAYEQAYAAAMARAQQQRDDDEALFVLFQ
jgi:hypothetical protein